MRVGGGVLAVQKDVKGACASIQRAALQQAAVATCLPWLASALATPLLGSLWLCGAVPPSESTGRCRLLLLPRHTHCAHTGFHRWNGLRLCWLLHVGAVCGRMLTKHAAPCGVWVQPCCGRLVEGFPIFLTGALDACGEGTRLWGLAACWPRPTAAVGIPVLLTHLGGGFCCAGGCICEQTGLAPKCVHAFRQGSSLPLSGGWHGMNDGGWCAGDVCGGVIINNPAHPGQACALQAVVTVLPRPAWQNRRHCAVMQPGGVQLHVQCAALFIHPTPYTQTSTFSPSA